MRHFDCNHLAPGTRNIVLGKLKNLCVTVTLLICFILYLRAISKYKPPGAYIRRGDLTGGFLRCKFGGLYLEGLIFGTLRYQCSAFLSVLRGNDHFSEAAIPQPRQSCEACRFRRISIGIVELWGCELFYNVNTSLQTKMLHISLTTKHQIKLSLHVLCQILGDICRGIQTPSVTSYHKHSVVAVTLELHKIISFPSQSLDITLLTQCTQPFTLCQATDKPHEFLYLDTGNRKRSLDTKAWIWPAGSQRSTKVSCSPTS